MQGFQTDALKEQRIYILDAFNLKLKQVSDVLKS